MNRGGKITFCLIGGLALTAGVRADDTVAMVDPYASVVERNIFGLKPLRPPDVPQDANPPPKITPDGIMSILGELQVLFKVAPQPKPGSPTTDETYILSEGQRQDDIEVVKIDEKNSVVTFNNHGETQTLPLVTTMPASTPAGGPEIPAIGRPAGLGGRFSPGLVNPGGGPGGRPRGGGGGAGAANYGGLGSEGNQGNVPSLGSAPSTHSNIYNAASQIPEGMTPEVQTIAIEANRIATQSQVDSGELPPLPATDLTPSDAVGAGGVPLAQPNTEPPK